MQKKRIPYLDFLKFFAIASVLLGHSMEQTSGNDYWDNPIYPVYFSNQQIFELRKFYVAYVLGGIFL